MVSVEPELVSTKTLSGLLDIPEKTIRGWVLKNQIPYRKMGRLVRFSMKEIREWYDRRKVTPVSNLIREKI